MRAVLMTFITDVPVDVLRKRLEQCTAALLSVPGLVMKTWIIDESIVGGFYLFEDGAAADAYLHGDVCEGLISCESFSYFKVSRFDVIDDLSVIAGSPEVTIRRETRRSPAEYAGRCEPVAPARSDSDQQTRLIGSRAP